MKYISAKTAASQMGLKYHTLLARIRAGTVKAKKFENSSTWMIHVNEINRIKRGGWIRNGARTMFRKEQKAWYAMLSRCYSKKRKDFHRYGGRGIKVCDRWKNSFKLFLLDMGPSPSPCHQIDRFPNKDGNYEPGNVRWATLSEQSKNRRPWGRKLSNGDRLKDSAHDASKRLGISPLAIYRRIRDGWDIKKALTAPKFSQR